jgi:hypothetical protein
MGRWRIKYLWRYWKKWSWPNLGAIPAFACRNWVKPRKAPVRITRVSAEIRTEDLSNTSLERHLFAFSPACSISSLPPNVTHIDYWRQIRCRFLTTFNHIVSNPRRHLWADCLENVRASTSHKPTGFHGLLQDTLARKADNLTALYEPTVYEMWEPYIRDNTAYSVCARFQSRQSFRLPEAFVVFFSPSYQMLG